MKNRKEFLAKNTSRNTTVSCIRRYDSLRVSTLLSSLKINTILIVIRPILVKAGIFLWCLAFCFLLPAKQGCYVCRNSPAVFPSFVEGFRTTLGCSDCVSIVPTKLISNPVSKFFLGKKLRSLKLGIFRL